MVSLPPPEAPTPAPRGSAIGSLAAYAGQRSGQGKITITGSQDDQKWLVLTIAGSAFTGAAAPSEALLDESRQFLARLASGEASGGNGSSLVGVVLARIIVEFYGGSLAVGPKEAPGFVMRLPAAA